MESARPYSFAKYVLALACVLGSYYVAARLGLMIAFRETHISPVWPPAGIAIGSILLFGFRIWPAITLGAFLANFVTGLSLITSLSISFGNTLEAILGGFIITRFCGKVNPLETSRGVLIFVLAAVSSSIFAALVGTTSVYFGGYTQDADFAYLWWTWWLGDSVGILVMAPVILAWSSDYSYAERGRVLQAVALYLILVTIGIVVFSRLSPYGIPLTYLTVPPVIIASFRYRQKGASLSALLLSAIAVWETVNGNGPFHLGSLNPSLLFLQMFIGVITVTALVLASVVTEWKQAEEARNILLRAEQSSRQRAEEALRVKEILVHEIHHRVKNNLQVISSMLNLQLRNFSGLSAKEVFAETNARIKAIALIHEKLYPAEDVLRVDFAEYARSLAEEILKAYSVDHGKIVLNLDAKNITIDIERALPLGLITNELISNSIKHAFPSEQSGEMILRLHREDGNLLFYFQDNGVGLSPGLDFTKSGTFGLRLIQILSQQLKGELEYPSGGGLRVQIKFPLGTAET